MSRRERLEVLRGVRELHGVEAATLQTLLPFFDEVCVPAGAVLAREGQLSHQLFVVAAGELEACCRGRASRLGPSDSFGWREMHDRGRHDATVVTMSPARLLVMGHSQFRVVDDLSGARITD